MYIYREREKRERDILCLGKIKLFVLPRCHYSRLMLLIHLYKQRTHTYTHTDTNTHSDTKMHTHTDQTHAYTDTHIDKP